MDIAKEIEQRANKCQLNIKDFIQYREELEKLDLLKEEFFEEDAKIFLKENYDPRINYIGSFFDMDKEKSCELYDKYPWIFKTQLKIKYKENQYHSMIKDVSVEDLLGLLILMKNAQTGVYAQLVNELENENIIEDIEIGLQSVLYGDEKQNPEYLRYISENLDIERYMKIQDFDTTIANTMKKDNPDKDPILYAFIKNNKKETDKIEKLMGAKYFNNKDANVQDIKRYLESELYEDEEEKNLLESYLEMMEIPKYIIDSGTNSQYSEYILEKYKKFDIISEQVKEKYGENVLQGLYEEINFSLSVQRNESITENLFEIPEKTEEGCEIENVDGVKICRLKGKPFNLLVHSIKGVDTTSVKKSEYIQENLDKWTQIENTSYTSTCLISEENMSCITGGKNFILTFLDVQPDEILATYKGDAQVTHEANIGNDVTDIHEILPEHVLNSNDELYKDIEELKKESVMASGKQYNEIVIAKNNGVDHVTKPNAIVYFKGMISEEQLSLAFTRAKQLNLPIIEIDEQIYEEMLMQKVQEDFEKVDEFEIDETKIKELEYKKNALSRIRFWCGRKGLVKEVDQKIDQLLEELEPKYRKSLINYELQKNKEKDIEVDKESQIDRKEEENKEQQVSKANQILGNQEIEQQEEKSLIVIDKRKNIFSKMLDFFKIKIKKIPEEEIVFDEKKCDDTKEKNIFQQGIDIETIRNGQVELAKKYSKKDRNMDDAIDKEIGE